MFRLIIWDLGDGLQKYMVDFRVFGKRSDHRVEKTPKFGSGGFLSIGELAEAKKAAVRRGIWFRALGRVERGIIDLTVKCVDCVKSERLAKLLQAIIDKLTLALESIADRFVRTIGLPLARKISDIAVSWGNYSASKWAEDRAFARFLVVNFG